MTIPRISPYPMPTRASVPQSRASWRLDPKRAALLVHDLQDYFLDFFDRQRDPIPALYENVSALLRSARAAGVPVIYTRQPGQQSDEQRGLLNDLWGPGITAFPERAGIAEAVRPAADDTLLDKWRYSAFQRTELLKLLRDLGRDQLVVTGIYAHIGCLLTSSEAFMSDVQPFFVLDAVADFSEEDHRMAVRYAAERCATVLDTQGALEALEASQAPRSGISATSSPEVLGVPSALVHEIAELLEVDPAELEPDANLLDWGLDSLRIMTLVERWRARGLDVSFVTLAERPTLEDFARFGAA